MLYVITSSCDGVCDTACVDACPVECIHGPIDLEAIRAMQGDERAGLGGVQLFIDPDECIGCGACEPECPVEAIVGEDAAPEDAARNAAFFRDRR